MSTIQPIPKKPAVSRQQRPARQVLLPATVRLHRAAETTVQQTTVMQQQAAVLQVQAAQAQIAVLQVPAAQAPITVLQVQAAVQTKAVRQAVPVP